MNDAEKFLVYCGLTCMGGSERKTCPCTHPRDCEMRKHPEFEAQRVVATTRLWRCALTEVVEPTTLQVLIAGDRRDG